MGQSERSLIRLGRRVAELQDRAPAARLDLERGRARLLEVELPGRGGGPRAEATGAPRLVWPAREGVASRPRRRVPARRMAARVAASLAAAVLVAALAVVLVVRPRAREPMHFELGMAEPGVVGEWIAAPPAAELPIRFSDGSLLRLAPGGRARVASVDADGAEVALERGALDLSVVHREGTRWKVRVGPFQVHVIGTRFETRWDPVTERFGVALREGAITVSGPVVGDARAVRAGERLTISPATNTLEVAPIDATVTDATPVGSTPVGSTPVGSTPVGSTPVGPTPVGSTPVGSTPVGSTPVGSTPVGSTPVGAPPVTARPSEGHLEPPRGHPGVADPSSSLPSAVPQSPGEAPGWRALALDARYKDALAAAEHEGFDAICGSASASDLHALGDAARLGGSSARAVQAFAAVRRRFPGSPEAASAAFLLGRIAQDQNKDHAGAARWFARYLSEHPAGAFAADAAGRLVEAEDRRGDPAGARRAAERYLAAYPNGSHAAYARRLLARGSRPSAEGTSVDADAAPEPPAP
ncbi:FecR domain-containing protein [Sorangium sp. So ce131]|uniref:FecR domain-containing protein n=1 Tax=Sorangium sp. So ce131 TaxID=3133282 RepID=UPI003F64887A